MPKCTFQQQGYHSQRVPLGTYITAFRGIHKIIILHNYCVLIFFPFFFFLGKLMKYIK